MHEGNSATLATLTMMLPAQQGTKWNGDLGVVFTFLCYSDKYIMYFRCIFIYVLLAIFAVIRKGKPLSRKYK